MRNALLRPFAVALWLKCPTYRQGTYLVAESEGLRGVGDGVFSSQALLEL